MNRKIILPILGLIGIIALSGIILYMDSEYRHTILQTVDIKQTPEIIVNSYVLEPLAVGLPFPYHLTIIDDDVFFNQRFTGKLFVIKNEEFQKSPILELDSENSKIRILGISSDDSSIFVHIAESKENKIFENNQILKYSWNGNSLNFIEVVDTLSLYTDEHHSGDSLVMNNGNIVSTIPVSAKQNDEEYYVYGIHGFDFDSITETLWHTSEVYWPEDLEEVDSLNQYEKIHIMSKPYKTSKSWEVPYYPNSILIPEVNFSTTYTDSLFVGFCKGVNSGGGLYEYPLNSERNEFLIPNTQSTLLNLNHDKFLIAENFYCISDIELGSNNAIYLTDYVSNGAIYKIAPKQ